MLELKKHLNPLIKLFSLCLLLFGCSSTPMIQPIEHRHFNYDDRQYIGDEEPDKMNQTRMMFTLYNSDHSKFSIISLLKSK